MTLSPTTPRDSSLREDIRGVVFLEKLIVYVPLMALFFGGFQLAELSTAKLTVMRASSAAARAAAVILPDDPAHYGGEAADVYGGQRARDVELAAGLVLASAPQLGADYEVNLGSQPPAGTEGIIEVIVCANYHCGGYRPLCGGDGVIKLCASSPQTYHGASYLYAEQPAQ